MIIIRYLVRETLKSQLAILFILLLIFFCQKLVRILGAAVDGDIPTNLVLSLLGLGIPEMAQLILPLSLFLGLLMTLGKLYTESEITVMHACGLSKAVLIKAAMILALFTGAVAAVNVMWAGPWSSRHQDEVLAEAKANPGMAALAQGQFQQASDGNAVMFIESVNGNRFHDVFLAQLRPKGNARPSVVVADSGELSQQKDGSQVVTLNKGTRFEGTAMLLYLVFFLLQTSIKSNGGKGKMDPAIWMWAINLLYFALAVLLNLWDTVPMRRFRARFNKGAA